MKISSFFKLSLGISSLILLAGCIATPKHLTSPIHNVFYNMDDSEIISKTKELMTYVLKDPSSAEYRNIRIAEITKGSVKQNPELLEGAIQYVCFDVNAKNSFGGYTGFKSWGLYGDGNVIADSHVDLFCNSEYKTYRYLEVK